jgi:hypothetical protein
MSGDTIPAFEHTIERNTDADGLALIRQKPGNGLVFFVAVADIETVTGIKA